MTSAAAKVKNRATDAGGWVETLARAGYAAKGILYLVIGLLAFQAAVGSGGKVGGSKGALSALEGGGAFGTVLLWVIFAGLIGYALWQFFRAAMDPEDEGTDAKGVVKRIFFAVSGVIHAALAVWVFTHLLGESSSGGAAGGGPGGSGGGTQGLVSAVLGWGTAGRLLVGLVGVGVAGFGIGQLVQAYRADLSDQLDLSSLRGSGRPTVRAVCRVGLAARGIVFVAVGFLALQAAWKHKASESGGTGEAVQWLGSFGPWVLAAIGLGLACYGVYMLVKSRYRRINPENA